MTNDNKGAACARSCTLDAVDDNWSDEEDERLRELGLGHASSYLAISKVHRWIGIEPSSEMPELFQAWVMANQDWQLSLFGENAADDNVREPVRLARRVAARSVLSATPISRLDLSALLIVWWQSCGPGICDDPTDEDRDTTTVQRDLIAEAWRNASIKKGEPRIRCMVAGGLVAV